MLTVKAAAVRLDISPSLVYALCREGVIRCTRHGRPGRRGTIGISEEAVAHYLAQVEQHPAADEGDLSHIRS